MAPSIIYTETVEQVLPVESDVESDSTINYSTVTNNVQESSQQQSESCTPVEETSYNFFSARNITVVKQRPKRKFVPSFVAGSLHKKTNQDILSDLSIKAASKAVPENKIPKTVQKTKSSTKKSTTVVNKCPNSAKKCSKVSSGKAQKTIQPVPSTSGLNKRKCAPIDLISEDSYDGDSDIFQ